MSYVKIPIIKDATDRIGMQGKEIIVTFAKISFIPEIRKDIFIMHFTRRISQGNLTEFLGMIRNIIAKFVSFS